MKHATWLLSAAIALGLGATGLAQTPPEGRLLITVVDPTGGVLGDATVIVSLQDGTTLTQLAPVKTSKAGLATVEHLRLGRYTIQAQFPGFDTALMKDVRVNAGDNKHVVVVPLKKIEGEVTVARDAQVAAADPRGGSFSTSLSAEEIAALSDDPTEMAQQLIDMAGGSAVIKVDSFLGGTLPPKALIKSIHIMRDTFPAENHSAESDEIDIITQPGVGPLHGGGSTRLRDGSLSGRSPFTPVKGPERTENVDGNIGGAIVANKSSFSISGSSRHAYDTPALNAALPSGTQAGNLGLRRPNNGWSTFGLFDYAVTLNHVLRMSYDQQNSTQQNLGVGAYDLAERAYGRTSQDHELRIQETGPISRRVYANTRLQLNWTDTASQSVTNAPTIRVLDAFTSGGAQVSGGRHTRAFEFGSDIDYLRGIHAVRLGVQLDGGHYRADDASNYLGTYVFNSLDAYAAGTPISYTRRIGDPLITYFNLQSGAYIQDDIRIRKGLTLSPGLRYEAQTHLTDKDGWGPRIGLTWAPMKSGKTTIRTSYGIFSNWLNAGTYEQTLRVDGVRQQEVSLVNPSYPDPGGAGAVSATSKYVLGPNVQMARTFRYSFGVDQTISPKVRVSANYANNRFADQLRGTNLNAPVNGVRPNPSFLNVIEVVSDARTRTQQFNSDLNVNFAAGVRNATRARWNIQRTTLRLSYRIARSFNNTDGAFVPPPTGTLDTEWAPSNGDRRHRIIASVTSQALKNLSVNVAVNAQSGSPYTITTGQDANGDTILNDRPAGAGRNTARTPWLTAASLSLSYAVITGPRRLTITLQAQNFTNRYNYSGFSGVMTSQFFMKPTAVSNPRKVDIGMNFTF